MNRDDTPFYPIPFAESRWLRHLYLVLGAAMTWWGVSHDWDFLALLLAALAISGWAKTVFSVDEDI